jgi:hypothetical protein
MFSGREHNTTHCVVKTVTLSDFKNFLQASIQQEDGFKEVCIQKKHFTEEAARTTKKVAVPTSSLKVAKKNFASLRTKHVDCDAPGTEFSTAEVTAPGKADRPPQ